MIGCIDGWLFFDCVLVVRPAMALSGVLLVVIVSFAVAYGEIRLDVSEDGAGKPESAETDPLPAKEVESSTVETVAPTTVPCDENTEYPICPPHVRCGFHQYNDTGHLIGKFITYCTCPAGTECRRSGEHKSQQFFYYKCVSVTYDPFANVLSMLATEEDTDLTSDTDQTKSTDQTSDTEQTKYTDHTESSTPKTVSTAAEGDDGVVIQHDDL